MRKELSREPFGNDNLKMCRFENLKMRNYKSLFYLIIIITYFQGCTRYVTVSGGMSSVTNYYFSAGFENKLIETRNDNVSEITYFSENPMMLCASKGYDTVCDFCNDYFEAEIILKNSNQKEFSLPLVCSDIENFIRKTVQIESGNYEVFMNLNCSGEKNKENRTFDMGELEIQNGEKRNLNIWIELDIDEDDVILSPKKISKREYRKLQKENQNHD